MALNNFKMINKKVLVALIAIIMLVSAVCTYMMAIDNCQNGEESITYSMANSNYNGWMFSSGRVSAYLTNEILADDIMDTGKNLVSFGVDLLQNFKSAAYFQYEGPTETGWYTGQEVTDWFAVTADERFDYGSVYVNAMGDDANSFFYYGLVHTVSSIFIEISDTPWPAFIVNMIALIFVMLFLFFTARKMGVSERISLLAVLCYGMSGACVLHATVLRVYVVASVFHLLLFMLHVALFEAAENNNLKQFKKISIMLACVYIVGYVSHYTILVWAAFLGLNTVIRLAKNTATRKAKFIWRYIVSGGIAICLGFVVDPVSVIGLSLKFFNAQSSETVDLINVLRGSIVSYVTVNEVGFWIVGISFMVALVLALKKKVKTSTDKEIFWLGSVILQESVVLLFVTKAEYYRALYPLFFLVVVYIYDSLFSFLKEKYGWKWGKIVVIGCVCLFGCASFANVLHKKKTEGVDIWAIEDVLLENKTEDIIYSRGAGSGYEITPFLQDYTNILTITSSKGTYEGVENTDEFLTADEFTVLVHEKADSEESLLLWLFDNGFTQQTMLYKNELGTVYSVRRDESYN